VPQSLSNALSGLQRLGFGGGPGEVSHIVRDPIGWAGEQAARPAELLPANTPDANEALRHFLTRRDADTSARGMNAEDGRQHVRDRLRASGHRSARQILTDALGARLARAHLTQAALAERLVWHWTDHFTASLSVAQVGYFLPGREASVIRPHLHGRFADMLKGAVLHPAMLWYLDQRRSIGPNSRIGVRSRGRLGLNENLGREILELHTMGTDGGYGQEDVVQLALALTGWALDLSPNPRSPQRTGFFPDRHEPGPKTLLGKTYSQDGPEQAGAILDDLARHPSTARHVTRRLVRQMVGEGLPAFEARLADVFRRTDGDLGAVTRALVTDPDAWGPPRKVRPPIEILFGAARLLGGLPPRPAPMAALEAMGQPFHAPGSPKGWPLGNNAWASPDGIKTRLDWAAEIASRVAPTTDARDLLETAFGPAASNETRRAVARAADGRQALTLLLMSPEFQRR
jgi:uncharacterized protein (DUF1800 family)